MPDITAPMGRKPMKSTAKGDRNPRREAPEAERADEEWEAVREAVEAEGADLRPEGREAERKKEREARRARQAQERLEAQGAAPSMAEKAAAQAGRAASHAGEAVGRSRDAFLDAYGAAPAYADATLEDEFDREVTRCAGDLLARAQAMTPTVYQPLPQIEANILSSRKAMYDKLHDKMWEEVHRHGVKPSTLCHTFGYWLGARLLNPGYHQYRKKERSAQRLERRELRSARVDTAKAVPLNREYEKALREGDLGRALACRNAVSELYAKHGDHLPLTVEQAALVRLAGMVSANKTAQRGDLSAVVARESWERFDRTLEGMCERDGVDPVARALMERSMMARLTDQNPSLARHFELADLPAPALPSKDGHGKGMAPVEAAKGVALIDHACDAADSMGQDLAWVMRGEGAVEERRARMSRLLAPAVEAAQGTGPGRDALGPVAAMLGEPHRGEPGAFERDGEDQAMRIAHNVRACPPDAGRVDEDVAATSAMAVLQALKVACEAEPDRAAELGIDPAKVSERLGLLLEGQGLEGSLESARASMEERFETACLAVREAVNKADLEAAKIEAARANLARQQGRQGEPEAQRQPQGAATGRQPATPEAEGALENGAEQVEGVESEPEAPGQGPREAAGPGQAGRGGRTERTEGGQAPARPSGRRPDRIPAGGYGCEILSAKVTERGMEVEVEVCDGPYKGALGRLSSRYSNVMTVKEKDAQGFIKHVNAAGGDSLTWDQVRSDPGVLKDRRVGVAVGDVERLSRDKGSILTGSKPVWPRDFDDAVRGKVKGPKAYVPKSVEAAKGAKRVEPVTFVPGGQEAGAPVAVAAQAGPSATEAPEGPYTAQPRPARMASSPDEMPDERDQNFLEHGDPNGAPMFPGMSEAHVQGVRNAEANPVPSPANEEARTPAQPTVTTGIGIDEDDIPL